jgi:hypothetical protein
MRLLLAALLAALAVAPDASRTYPFGVFVGTTPAGDEVRRALGIPAGSKADLVVWTVTLQLDSVTRAPEAYELRAEYGSTGAGAPGIARIEGLIERRGSWTVGWGIPSNREVVVHELKGALSFVEVGPDVLHALNPDRSFMVGNSGWSHTLTRSDRAEPLVDARLAADQPERSYQLEPLASGPAVFGVFEGRTPCQGIAYDLRVAVDAACTKAKWRVTLYQDPDTKAPTNAWVEGSLYPGAARKGTWTLTKGTRHDAGATVYRLALSAATTIALLKGGDNVAFFLDDDDTPRAGNHEFAYTLHRRP